MRTLQLWKSVVLNIVARLQMRDFVKERVIMVILNTNQQLTMWENFNLMSQEKTLDDFGCRRRSGIV